MIYLILIFVIIIFFIPILLPFCDKGGFHEYTVIKREKYTSTYKCYKCNKIKIEEKGILED